VTAIAEHGDSIRQLKDFRQPVGNINNADAAGPQAGNRAEQACCFGSGEGRRGFIHDDQTGIDGERPGNFHQLLLRHSKLFDQAGRVYRVPHGGQQFARTPVDLVPGNSQAIYRVPAEKDIFADAQLRNERQFLVNETDPQCPPVGRSLQLDG
jgi:hypothetical protein